MRRARSVGNIGGIRGIAAHFVVSGMVALLAAPAFAGLASIPLGSFTTASPCDGIAGEHVPSGLSEVFIEVEGARTVHADGSVRYAQGRAQITRMVDGNASIVCLDARSGGSIWMETHGVVLLTQKRAGVDVVSVRVGAERNTVTSLLASAPWDRLLLPRAGGSTLEGMVLDPDFDMMVLDPDDGLAIGQNGIVVLDNDGEIALDTHVVFRAGAAGGPAMLVGSLPLGDVPVTLHYALVKNESFDPTDSFRLSGWGDVGLVTLFDPRD